MFTSSIRRAVQTTASSVASPSSSLVKKVACAIPPLDPYRIESFREYASLKEVQSVCKGDPVAIQEAYEQYVRARLALREREGKSPSSAI